MTAQEKLCITVCTRNRPRMLENLLDSFVTLQKPDLLDLAFVIVENDQTPSVEQIIIAKQQRSNYRFIYQLETRLGIPVARNRCVAISLAEGASHIAFVDDDEVLPPDWLLNIWSYYKTQSRDSVIQGPVIPVFDKSAPEHLKSFFGSKPHDTGTALHMCATNNVLVPMTLFQDLGLRFDESRPLAGGTDSKLFRQAKARGMPLVFCAEAPVLEEIPGDRTTLGWLTKRHFRVGLTIGEHREFPNALSRLGYIALKLRDILWRGIKAVIYQLSGKKYKFVKTWLKVCRSAGELLGPAGIKVDSYKSIQGS